MASTLHQPHDHLFRLVFADPEETAAFLRARLPDSYQGGILWSSLRRAAGSFVDQELRGSVTDLLFEVRSAAAAPRQWLYLLFEHQSQPDRWMALRLLRYCCRIWENDRRDHPDEQYLRPVLPLVFYQGEHHWHYAIELAESFPPALRGQPWVPRFCPLLLDQTRMAPAAVAGELHGRLLQLAMMHTFEQELGEARKRIAPLIGELKWKPTHGGVDYYQAFLRYIVKTGPADTLEALGELLRRLAPELRGDLMTCGEILRREGELKGRQEGRLEGRLEGELKGRREGRLETIDGFLRAGIKWPVIQSATGIDEPTYRALKRDAANGTEQAAPRQ